MLLENTKSKKTRGLNFLQNHDGYKIQKSGQNKNECKTRENEEKNCC